MIFNANNNSIHRKRNKALGIPELIALSYQTRTLAIISSIILETFVL